MGTAVKKNFLRRQLSARRSYLISLGISALFGATAVTDKEAFDGRGLSALCGSRLAASTYEHIWMHDERFEKGLELAYDIERGLYEHIRNHPLLSIPSGSEEAKISEINETASGTSSGSSSVAVPATQPATSGAEEPVATPTAQTAPTTTPAVATTRPAEAIPTQPAGTTVEIPTGETAKTTETVKNDLEVYELNTAEAIPDKIKIRYVATDNNIYILTLTNNADEVQIKREGNPRVMGIGTPAKVIDDLTAETFNELFGKEPRTLLLENLNKNATAEIESIIKLLDAEIDDTNPNRITIDDNENRRELGIVYGASTARVSLEKQTDGSYKTIKIQTGREEDGIYKPTLNYIAGNSNADTQLDASLTTLAAKITELIRSKEDLDARSNVERDLREQTIKQSDISEAVDAISAKIFKNGLEGFLEYCSANRDDDKRNYRGEIEARAPDGRTINFTFQTGYATRADTDEAKIQALATLSKATLIIGNKTYELSDLDPDKFKPALEYAAKERKGQVERGLNSIKEYNRRL